MNVMSNALRAPLCRSISSATCVEFSADRQLYFAACGYTTVEDGQLSPSSKDATSEIFERLVLLYGPLKYSAGGVP